MRNSIRLRVGKSFKAEDHEDLTEYLEWLRSTINDMSRSLQRTMISMVLLIAAFEFIDQSPKSQITLGPFRIYEGSIILVFIPALVAYLYLEALTVTARVITMRVVFKNAFAKWNASAEQNDLGLFVLTSMPLYWSIGVGAERPENATNARKVVLPTTFLLTTLVLFGPITYEAQAYYRLYSLPGSSILLLISTCITVFCIIAGLSSYSAYGADFGREMARDTHFAERYPRLSSALIPTVVEVKGDAVSGDPSDRL